jgi:hypothetical protein
MVETESAVATGQFDPFARYPPNNWLTLPKVLLNRQERNWPSETKLKLWTFCAHNKNAAHSQDQFVYVWEQQGPTSLYP